MIILLLKFVEIYIAGYNNVLIHTIIIMKCGTSDFVLPSVSVRTGEIVNLEEEKG